MKRNRNKIEMITGVDIGSTAIRLAVAQQSTDRTTTNRNC